MRLRLFWAAKMSQLFDSVRRHILVLPFFHFLYRSPRCLDDLPYPTGLITGIYSHRKKEERKKGLPLGKKTKASYWFRKLISLGVSCLLFHTISTYACWIVCNYRQEARRLTITAQSLDRIGSIVPAFSWRSRWPKELKNQGGNKRVAPHVWITVSLLWSITRALQQKRFFFGSSNNRNQLLR